MRGLIASVLFLIALTAYTAINATVALFIDLPALCIVFGTILFGLLGKHGLEFYRDDEQLLARTIGTSGVYGGVIAALLGFIIMLNNLSNPEKIGPSMALSMLGALYGMVVFFCCYIVQKETKVPKTMIFLPLISVGINVFSYLALSTALAGV